MKLNINLKGNSLFEINLLVKSLTIEGQENSNNPLPYIHI